MPRIARSTLLKGLSAPLNTKANAPIDVIPRKAERKLIFPRVPKVLNSLHGIGSLPAICTRQYTVIGILVATRNQANL
jgi:hypothetical protein